MMEQWTRWEPISGLEGRYTLNSFLWSKENFVIELINWKQEKKIQILFYYHVDAYRYTNESFYLTVLDNASPNPDTGFYENYSLFKVTNSEYLAWLSEKSCTWSDQLNFIHFCIIGGDEMIDIVARYEPKVTIMEYKPEEKKITYTRQEFGLKLKEKIKNKENIADISQWIFNMYCEHIHNVEEDFQEILRDLVAMKNDSQFKLSYEILNNLADRLIAGEQNIDLWDQYTNW